MSKIKTLIMMGLLILLIPIVFGVTLYRSEVYDYTGKHIRSKVNYSLLDADKITTKNITVDGNAVADDFLLTSGGSCCGGSGGNASWNESYANTLYDPIGSGTDNESWNESLANSLYLGIDDQRYNNTDLIVSNNDTINLNLTAIWNNFANYLITTSIYTILSGNMTLAYVNDSRIETKLDSVGNWSADEQGIRDDITNNASATLSACYLNDTNNSAGNGIALTSSVFSVAAGNGLTQDANGISTNAITAGANQYSYWDGNSWEARNDDDTTYSAGNGMGLSSTTFSVSAGNGLTQDASGLSTNAITASTGQYSYWDGNSWEARNDNYSTSLAFTGTSTKTLTITGRDSNTFSNTFTDIDTTYSNSSPINLTGTVFGLTPCPDTQIYAYNSSYGGWECQSKSSSGGGTVTSVSGDGDYVLGTVTSAGSFTFNESRLNATIDLRSDVAGVSSFLNYTPGTYNGSLVSAGAVGYEAGTLLCNSAYSGSHMCTMDEVIRQQNNGEYDNFTATFWVSEGAPGFTANANDCIGWKGDTATFLGAIWVGNVVDGGNGALTACNNKRALGCCI